MQGYKSGNKHRRNVFEISAKLSHCDIFAQINFVNTLERAQVISHICPHAFSCVRVDFPNTIAIVVTCPFMFSMANGLMFPNNVIVRVPLICITSRIFQCKPMNMSCQCLSICVVNHAQACLPTFSSYRSDNWRTIIIVGSMPAPFVGSFSWRVFGIRMSFTFFPPNSGTFRLFQNEYRGARYSVVQFLRWLAPDGAWSTRFCNSIPVRQPVRGWSPLCKCLA